MAQDRSLDAGALFERLAVESIQMAADTLQPVYEATGRRDGFVSIEVSPYLWEPPSEEEFQQAVRVLALRILPCICGYGEESSVARSKRGSIESRLVTAHKMLAPPVQQSLDRLEAV